MSSMELFSLNKSENHEESHSRFVEFDVEESFKRSWATQKLGKNPRFKVHPDYIVCTMPKERIAGKPRCLEWTFPASPFFGISFVAVAVSTFEFSFAAFVCWIF